MLVYFFLNLFVDTKNIQIDSIRKIKINNIKKVNF